MKDFFKKLAKYIDWQLKSATQKKEIYSNMIKELETVPETAALLQMAKDKNVPIVMDPGLGFGNTSGFWQKKKKRIHISPFSGWPARTLAHELRHMWQETRIADPLCYTPTSQLLMLRLMEADAETFAYVFAHRLTGYELDIKQHINQMSAELKEAKDTQEKQSIIAAFNEKGQRISFPEIEVYKERIESSFISGQKDLYLYDQKFLHLGYLDCLIAESSKKPIERRDLTEEEIRSVLRIGVNDNAPVFFADKTNDEIRKILTADIKPEVWQAATLMDRFLQAGTPKEMRAELKEKYTAARRALKKS